MNVKVFVLSSVLLYAILTCSWNPSNKTQVDLAEGLSILIPPELFNSSNHTAVKGF